MAEEASREILRQAFESGVTFIDTANIYSDGHSEEIVGRAVRDLACREEVVIATKVYARMQPGPKGGGLSRAAIFTQVDQCLRRLGTDYIDLLQIHRLDSEVTAEETLAALNDIVKDGKARYLGASSMPAWQFTKLLYLADLRGWTRFVSMQGHYNLLYREEEREMLPLCADQGIGYLPWSPLARGRLARDPGAPSDRVGNDVYGSALYDPSAAADALVVDAVGRVAARRGMRRSQVALAWLLSRPGLTAPIVGLTKQHHLTDAIAALDVELDHADIAELVADYRPHAAGLD